MPAAHDESESFRNDRLAQPGPEPKPEAESAAGVGAGTAAAAGVTFETHLTELQRIVSALERGDLGLEESLARFEQGVGLLRRCQQLLAGAEQRIELLTGFTAEGVPVTRPFDASATFVDRAPGGGGEPVEGEAKRKRARRSIKPDAANGETTVSPDETPRLF